MAMDGVSCRAAFSHKHLPTPQAVIGRACSSFPILNFATHEIEDTCLFGGCPWNALECSSPEHTTAPNSALGKLLRFGFFPRNLGQVEWSPLFILLPIVPGYHFIFI